MSHTSIHVLAKACFWPVILSAQHTVWTDISNCGRIISDIRLLYLTLGACANVTVVILCVCVCLLPSLYVESWVPLGFLCCSQHMYCVDFVENTLFNSSGEICWSPLPSSLLDELSMDKRDSDGFFSRRLACRTNDRSYNSTDSSLVTVDYQQCFLACFLCFVAKLLIRQVHGHASYYVIACNCKMHIYSCGYSRCLVLSPVYTQWLTQIEIRIKLIRIRVNALTRVRIRIS